MGRLSGHPSARRRDHQGSTWCVHASLKIIIHLPLGHTGRETFLFPVKWIDGWPTFNNSQPLGLTGPGLYTHSIESTSFEDDFSSTSLDLGYYHLRTPYLRFWSLVDRPGWLRLQGGAFTLGDREQPSLLL